MTEVRATGLTESERGAISAALTCRGDVYAAVERIMAGRLARVEAVLNPDGHPDAHNHGRAAVWADDVRAALRGDNTPVVHGDDE